MRIAAALSKMVALNMGPENSLNNCSELIQIAAILEALLFTTNVMWIEIPTNVIITPLKPNNHALSPSLYLLDR